jgi:hypothetical protein
LDDRHVDAAQKHQILQILQRATAEDGKDSEFLGIEHIREIRNDPYIGTIRAAG